MLNIFLFFINNMYCATMHNNELLQLLHLLHGKIIKSAC